MSIRSRRITDRGQIVSANTLAGSFDFLVLDDDRLDQNFPLMVHDCVGAPSLIEFGYIDSSSGELRRLITMGEKI